MHIPPHIASMIASLLIFPLERRIAITQSIVDLHLITQANFTPCDNSTEFKQNVDQKIVIHIIRINYKHVEIANL